MITAAAIRALNVDVDAALLNGMNAANVESVINWQEVAVQKNASVGKVIYGFSNDTPPIKNKTAAGYSFAEAAVNSYAITSNRYGRGLKITVDDLKDDKFGLFEPIIRGLGARMTRFPQTLIWDWLKEGDQTAGPAGKLFAGRDMTTADGVAFFSTSHKVNINDAALSTQSNLLTTTALNSTNFPTVYSAFINMKDTEGLPLGLMPNRLYVPPALEYTAAQVLYASTITTGGVNVFAPEMLQRLKRNPIEIVVVPELSGDAGIWYLANKSDNGAPCIWQVTEPLALVPHTDPQADNVFYDDELEWLAKGRVEVGWGDYRRVIRCEA